MPMAGARQKLHTGENRQFHENSFMPRIHAKHKIALVVTELDVGGAERCLTNLATGLDPSRFAPAVIVLGPRPSPPRDTLVAQLQQSQVPVEFLNFSSKWGLFAAVRQLAKTLDATAPQLVQSMLFHANVLTRMALPSRAAPVWCAGIRVADPSRLRQVVERRAMSKADRVVCVSHLVADYVNRRMRTPREKLAVVANGVDTQAVVTREPADMTTFGVPASRRIIVCIARLEKQKGIDQLLAAAPTLLRALPAYDLVIVGAGRQSHELARMARRTPVAKRIHFCGWQPNVGEMLLASDLLVLPSRWEGMPNVVLEAMASSRPVVCTEVEGVVQALGPLAPQQTAPAGMPQVLSEKIVRILSDPALADQLGASNRQRVVAHFSLSAMVRQYETLYLNLFRSRETRPKNLF